MGGLASRESADRPSCISTSDNTQPPVPRSHRPWKLPLGVDPPSPRARVAAVAARRAKDDAIVFGAEPRLRERQGVACVVALMVWRPRGSRPPDTIRAELSGSGRCHRGPGPPQRSGRTQRLWQEHAAAGRAVPRGCGARWPAEHDRCPWRNFRCMDPEGETQGDPDQRQGAADDTCKGQRPGRVFALDITTRGSFRSCETGLARIPAADPGEVAAMHQGSGYGLGELWFSGSLGGVPQ